MIFTHGVHHPYRWHSLNLDFTKNWSVSKPTNAEFPLSDGPSLNLSSITHRQVTTPTLLHLLSYHLIIILRVWILILLHHHYNMSVLSFLNITFYSFKTTLFYSWLHSMPTTALPQQEWIATSLAHPSNLTSKMFLTFWNWSDCGF